VFYTPQHPYTWGLLASMPRLDRVRTDRLDPIPGNPPSLINLPSGCAFNPRCAHRGQVEGDRCRTEVPELLEARPGQSARCHIDPARRSDIYAQVSGQKP
jgi:peptide/nickel transport system ATP-binding protein